MSSKSFAGSLLFSIACILVCPGRFVSAQATINNASISGNVADITGAVIENAKVTVRHTATNQSNSASTDSEGRFRFTNLRLGPHEISVSKQGFSDLRLPITLTVGSAFEIPVVLAVASTQNSVTITGEAAVLEAARTQIAGTVQQAEVRSLPLNGRNVLDLALLIPGVSPTNTASTQLFAETSAVPGQGLSVGSQRNFSNSFIVDGLSNNDDAAGLTGASYGADVVSEFQVVTSGGQAEFGRALGGYVNVVTKSGTNLLHGDLYGYFRNQRLNAANPISHATLPLTQAQYGVSLGGPVIHDRTFYFANLERRELNQSGLTTISLANAAAINARLLAVAYPGPQLSTGVYPNPVHSANFFGKVEHQISDKDQVNLRYSLYRINSANSRGAGGLSAPTTSANLNSADQTIAVGNIVALTPRLANETRAQFTNSDLQAPPTDPIGPAVSISGVASFGTLSGSPTGRLNRMVELVENLSYQAGPQTIRFGSDFLYNRNTITFPRSIRGSYSFSSLANFLNGAYNNSGFTQTFATSTVVQNNPNVGLYAQDEWKVNSKLTLNLGLRYDLQYLKTIATDSNNLSPRAGFAWSPFSSRKTVIRGGYGLFYDRVPLRALANALLSAGNSTDAVSLRQISVSLSPTQTAAPVFPNILSSLTLPAGILLSFTTMDRKMQNAYSVQGSFEIEHQFGGSSTLSIGYQHVRGLHLIVSVNRNVPTCAASGGNNGCRPNPNFANNSQYSSLADSHFDGLHFSFLQRPAKWGSFRISYTYSKALDNVGEFFFSSPVNPYNIWEDYGRSDDDQRHRLVFDGTVHSRMTNGSTTWERLMQGFQLTGMIQYYSALPFNITSGSNTIQGTPGRPTVNGVFISRNAGSGFSFLNLNARISRTFHVTERLRMEALVEGFNLTNHVNGVTLNGVFGSGTYPTAPSATFKQVTAVGDARTFQVAVRFSY